MSILELLEQQNEVCFITERITGGSLLQYIKRINAPLKQKVIKNWCRQILEGGLKMLKDAKEGS